MEKALVLRNGLETDFGFEGEKKGSDTEVGKLTADNAFLP
jgi:hypothetical protein